MAKLLSKKDFDPYLNDQFKITTEEHGVVELELVEVVEMSRDNLETFSLLFKGSREMFFDQKNYKVKHQKLGNIELFLVPVLDKRQDAFYYESIFNRLKEEKP